MRAYAVLMLLLFLLVLLPLHLRCACRFSASVVDVVGSLGLTWQPAFGIILVLYFYSHYFFASGERYV
jgi:hypothetical protein